jgi:hypothetical protein
MAFVLFSNHATLVALAAVPSAALLSVPAVQATQLPCDAALGCVPQLSVAPKSELTLPAGLTQCPESGPGAACASDAPTGATIGSPSVPDSQPTCPEMASKPLVTTPAACSDTVLGGTSPSASTIATSQLAPSVPVASLGTRWSSQKLDLKVSANSVRSGVNALLTATSTVSVTSTDSAIEIFDQASGTLIGACSQGSQCVVAFSSQAGTHTFAAFITQPTSKLPVAGDVPVASNTVKVSWLGVTLSSDSPAVGPGHAITFTAKSTIDVANSGHVLEIYDGTSNKMLTYCTRGTQCSTSYQMTNSASHLMVGYLSGVPDALSSPLGATWLSVALNASTLAPQSGQTVYLRATTNTDLSKTPWSVGIFDAHGTLVALCKTGYVCNGSSSATNSPYTAVVGSVAAPTLAGKLSSLVGAPAPSTSLTNIQVHSAAVEPARVIWGVDSCKAMTTDGGTVNGLYADVSYHMGSPGVWGRYLTDTVCPGISAAEISIAHRLRLGILPIYNEYNCSAVVGYDTGYSYGIEATNAAAGKGIPAGRVIAIDIEPPGDACPGAAYVDAGFVQGWYDGVTAAHYAPAYYGNGTAGSEFASAWCSAVSPETGRPEIAAGSYLWSFEPSYINAGDKSNPPAYAPYGPGCVGNTVAWQYQLSAGAAQDVDLDLVLTSMPLWFP